MDSGVVVGCVATGRCFDAVVTALPPQTRFVTKYRSCDGALVLKVTNDIQCLKYKTDNSADLKNVERLTSWFLSQSTRKHVAASSKAGAAASGAGGDE